jgi:hypothetical protein
MTLTTSSAVRVMPPQEELRKLLSSLFGRPIVVTRSPALIRQSTEKYTVAIFTQDTDEVGVVAVADLAFTAYAGAALTMFPTPMAERQIETGRVDEMVFENFREIMNICASAFNTGTNPHVTLGTLLRLPIDTLPPALDASLRKPIARLDFAVQIPNYGAGKLSFLAV